MAIAATTRPATAKTVADSVNQRSRCLRHAGGIGLRQHVPRRKIADQSDLISRERLEFAKRDVEAHVEQVHAHLGQERRADLARGIVVEKAHRDILRVELPECGQTEGAELILAHEPDDVVEHKDAVDRGKGLALQTEPTLQKSGDLPDEEFALFRLHHQRGEELGRAHQEAGDVQRTARDGEPDLVSGSLDVRLRKLKAVEHKRQQAVRPRVRHNQVVYVSRRADDPVRMGKLVGSKSAARSEGGRLGAHPVLRPEARQEENVGKRAQGLQVGLEPDRVVAKVIQDTDAVPVRQPWAVDDKGCGSGCCTSP
jgi:hypothetical protein